MKITNNKRFIFHTFSVVLIVFASALVPSLFVSIMYRELRFCQLLLYVMAVCFTVGFIGRSKLTYRASTIKPRVYFFTTLFSWVALIMITALIYYLSGALHNIPNAIFEATASWTTTGTDAAPHLELIYGMQMLRSTCNWLGGVGIIIIVAGLLPDWNFTGHSLVITEIPGPAFLKKADTFRRTYSMIIKIYAGLTAMEFIMLMLTGMKPFTALLTALSGISTSGIQHIEHGIIIHLGTATKVVISIFSVLGSINFSFFILLLTRKFKMLSSRTEFRFYLGRIIVTTVFITLMLVIHDRAEAVIKDAGQTLMQVISCLSTSSYTISDCKDWPTICILALMLQMFIGTCAMSTGGGIKVGRFAIALKTIKHSMFKHIHPSADTGMKYNNKTLSSDQIMDANLFVAMFMLLFIVGAALLSIDTNDIHSALDYSQAMITNSGKTMYELMSGSYSALTGFSGFSKIVMSVLMLAGRLEIYPLAMIFFRSFWVRDKNL